VRKIRDANLAVRERLPEAHGPSAPSALEPARAGRRSDARLTGAWAIIDSHGVFLGVSSALARAVATHPETLCGSSAFDLIHPDDASRAKVAFAFLWSGASPKKVRVRFQSSGGHWRRVEIAAALIARNDAPAEAVIQARFVDAAQPREALPSAFSNARPDVVGAVLWDLDFRLKSWNSAAEQLFGYTQAELAGTMALERMASPGARMDVEGLRSMLLAQRNGVRLVSRAVTKSGTNVDCEWFHAPVLDAQGTPCGFASAVSVLGGVARGERRAMLHDALTGIPSTALFMDRLERAVASASRDHADLAVFLIDIDHFASVNSGLGHRIGDALLREVASRLSVSLRHADSFARLGGDKFLALLVNVGGREGASQIARRILQTFAEPFLIESHRLVQTASIGISQYPDDALDAETLLACADAAMYAAKELGRDVYQFYAATAGASDRMSLERALRDATERNEFELYFQPQIDMRSGAVCGAEALLRWHHPTRGLLMPSDFVALAEETGLIVPIGTWVLRTACAAMRTWKDAGICVPRITVNVSGRELRRRLVDEVAQVLCDTNVDPDSLELELTETVTMRSSESHPYLLDELKSFGVRLAVDDFGVGYSSLAYLQRFPIDTLKIDRLFVGDCLTNRANGAIVQAIVTMAHGMELEVVAEGVETIEQAEFLRSLGCDGAQGFLYSPPLPADEFARLIADSPVYA
jgi:diguanylate cyclase (GGDEF)-like protein/PAS domain S-box-containing protein